MSVIEEIKARVDIVELISRYTPLKRSGSTYKAPCPFHNERTPSFVVFPQSGIWRCFGACGVGGDVFKFLMKRENLEFREAVQMLAQQVGIDLSQRQDQPDQRQRTNLYEINGVAANYFHEVLLHHAAAQPARDYLQRRGLDAATIERFQLGFALDQWNSLRDYLSARGYAIDQQLAATLVKRHEEKESIYDAFRGRVMIPIRDRQSRVIGFGGRILGDGQPKYLNTADTPLFHKSHVVYGIDFAQQAIRTSDQVVIVEGYMDVIAAHQHGYANVVACMGTSLTAEQLKQLQRYTNHFILALDADAAGQAATIRGLNQARQSLAKVQKPTVLPDGVRMAERLGANLAIISVPEGKDPDELIRKNPQLWQEVVASAKPLVDFYIDAVCSQMDVTSAAGKGQAVAELTPLIAELESETERQHYSQRLARLLRIDEATVDMRIQAAARIVQAGIDTSTNRRRTRTWETDSGEILHTTPTDEESVGTRDSLSSPTNRQTGVGNRLRRPPVALGVDTIDPENHLLANVLREPKLLVWLTEETTLRRIATLEVDDLERIENQEILRSLHWYLNGSEPWDLELFQEALPEELRGRFATLLAYSMGLPPTNESAIKQDALRTLVSLRTRRLRTENTNIKYLLDDAQQSHDKESMQNFGRSFDLIRRELSHLHQLHVNLSQAIGQRASTQAGTLVTKNLSA